MKRVVLGNFIEDSTRLAAEQQSYHRQVELRSRRKAIFYNVLCVNSGWAVDQMDVRAE